MSDAATDAESIPLSQEASLALFEAVLLASWQGANEVGPRHLMHAACQAPIGFALLKRAGADPHWAARSVRGRKGKTKASAPPPYSDQASAAVEEARQIAELWMHPQVTSGHLLIAAANTRIAMGRRLGKSMKLPPKLLRRVGESSAFMATSLSLSDLFAHLLDLDWMDESARRWLENRHIQMSIEYTKDLRASAALLRSSAAGRGPDVYRYQGALLGTLMGDTALTLRSCEGAERDTSMNKTMREWAALAFAHQGRFEEARETIDRLLDRKTPARHLVVAAQVEHLAEQPDTARKLLNGALRKLAGEPRHVRQNAEVLWHSIDGGFDHALKAIVEPTYREPLARMLCGQARIALARDGCLAGERSAIEELYAVRAEFGKYGMGGVALDAMTVLAESHRANGDDRFDETRRRAVIWAIRLSRFVTLNRLRHL